MKSSCLSLILGMLVSLLYCGCATIVTGTFQSVDFESSPSGAEVFVNGNFMGTTPCTIVLDQGTEPYIVLKKEGYADTCVELKKGANGWLFLDVFTGIVPGLIVDSRAGASRSFKEDDVCIPLLLADEKQMSFCGGNVVLSNVSAVGEAD